VNIGWSITGSGVDPCCCPAACCLYPWPDPDGIAGGPFYPDTDLPDAIDVLDNGTPRTLSRVPGMYRYEGLTATFIEADAALGAWTAGSFDVVEAGSPCLIGTWLASPPDTFQVMDQFSDTYTVTDDTSSFPDFVVTRDPDNPCRWTGTSEGLGVVVDYNITTPYKWTITFAGGPLVHDDPQTGPDGHYGTPGFGVVLS
jgi:hypothetical protein